jgi:hypothetical protein
MAFSGLVGNTLESLAVNRENQQWLRIGLQGRTLHTDYRYIAVTASSGVAWWADAFNAQHACGGAIQAVNVLDVDHMPSTRPLPPEVFDPWRSRRDTNRGTTTSAPPLPHDALGGYELQTSRGDVMLIYRVSSRLDGATATVTDYTGTLDLSSGFSPEFEHNINELTWERLYDRWQG